MSGYLGQLIHSQDEPIADWVCIPLYFVSKLARDSGTTVVQVGEGSDEQFCGYASYMEYLELYRRYWSPFRRWLPQPRPARDRRGVRRRWRGYVRGSPVTPTSSIARRATASTSGAARRCSGTSSSARVHRTRNACPHGTAPAALLVTCGLLPESYLQPRFVQRRALVP